VFSLLAAALWSIRRRGVVPRKGRSLEQVEKLSLTPNHVLHLIRVEGRDIVVATHPQGCTLIHGTADRATCGTVSGGAPIGRGAGA
jgi:flagellar biogenesis protein FliO